MKQNLFNIIQTITTCAVIVVVIAGIITGDGFPRRLFDIIVVISLMNISSALHRAASVLEDLREQATFTHEVKEGKPQE